MATSPDFASLLRGAGLRSTRPRLAVLAAVHDHPHADTETIIGATRAREADVSHQTVYDALHAMTAVGLIRRIQPNGSVARYECRVGDNHHHLVCRSCGVIADIDCAVGAAPCLTPADPNATLAGFTVDEAEVIYWGRCPACSAADAAGSPSSDLSSPSPFHHRKETRDHRHLRQPPAPPRHPHPQQGQREREPGDPVAHPDAAPAADQPGLVARAD